MVGRFEKRGLKNISIVLIAILVICLLVGKIFSHNDNHYVLDVVKDIATVNDGTLQVSEKIVKGTGEKEFNSKELDYEVELKNITQDTNVETQVAMVIDTSYSMEINDTNNVVKTKAIELASGIIKNVNKSRVSICNNNARKIDMTNYNSSKDTNINIITNQINALVYGEGSDSNNGLQLAVDSFTNTQVSNDKVNKYIIVFTDSTDDVSSKMQEITTADPSIKVISILVDMTSNSYIVNNQPVCGEVYLLLSEIEGDDITNNVEILDLQKIYDEMNRTVNAVTVTNEFSDEILTYFNISNLVTDVGEVKQTSTGYTWNLNKIKFQDTAKLKFKLTLKTNIDIDAGVIFNELYTNKTQNVTYNTYNSSDIVTLNGTDSREQTESTIIKICQGYDLTIKAVNESNKELEIEGIEFKVIGTNKEEEEVCNLTKTTDSNGNITITADEARALRGDGTIVFTVEPSVNKVGYSKTDSVQFSVTNNKATRKLETDDYGNSKIKIDSPNEEKRLINIEIPINSQRIDFELKVEELNNSNVTISGAEFELIQPKLNNKYEMDVLSGTTDDTGTIHFTPTVMTKDGTYSYILRQVSVPDGYEVTALTLITIKFENGLVTEKPGIQFNPNVKTEKLNDKDNHVLITVGNENVEQNPFDLQINLEDITDGTRLDGVTYLVKTINANNQVRNEFVTTDKEGQINTKIYGNGNLRIEITEQSPKVGYVADTQTKELIINRNNGIITVWNASPTDLDKETPNDESIIVNLKSQKKAEQNIVKVSIVDSVEQDVAVGAGIVYNLIDTETGKQYGPLPSNRNGEIAFTIDQKSQGQHIYKLKVDNNTVPDEYDNPDNEVEIILNLEFDSEGYIVAESVGNGNQIVIEDYASTINNTNSVEFTAFLKIAYEMNVGNTTEFKIQLLDHDDMTKVIEGASYNIDIEWDINGTTRTKTITGRRTNSSGQISTRIIKGDEVRIYVTQVGAKAGYNVDLTTQEIYVTFANNGTPIITQSPYDLGATNTEEPNQGAYASSGNIIYKHLNKKRTSEDTYVNLTINKIDMNGAYVDGVLVNIKSESLVDKDGEKLNLNLKTGAQGSTGTITIDYNQYLQDVINNNIIRVPGIGTSSEEIVYDMEISELKSDNSIKDGTTVKLRLIFRYKDGRVTLTNVETIYGNRLVKDKIFSSSSDTSEGQQLEDSLGVYLSNVTLDLYTNYEDVGNLSLDFKKQNKDEEELIGAKYSLKVTNPDSTVIRKEITISNGQDSSDIEISGINVNVGSIIELTEIEAPIGYGINTNTETLEVTAIDDDGEITIEQKDIAYNPNRLKLEKLVSTTTSSGSVKTNYEVTFTDYQLDIFEFEIIAKDSSSLTGVEGYTFKVDSSKGATSTITTGNDGVGSTRVGGNVESNTITYTVSVTKVADYYKPLSSLINVNVVFDEFGKVDTIATQNAQTDSNYGTLWKIVTLSDADFGKIGIDILVDHQDPLAVKMQTIDKITNAQISDVSYKITDSIVLPATGSTSIEVGYVLENGVRTYTISQTDLKNSYAKVSDKTFTVTYANENLTNATLSSTTSEDNITITGNKEVTIKIFVEPKVPFEISNLYYFDTNTKLQGSNFEVISQRNDDTISGTTDANGMTGIYSDIFGTTDGEEVIYKVRQTKGAIGYATVEDFYVKVTYGADREITAAKLVDQYGNDVTNNRFVTVSFTQSSSYSNYNSNNKEIVINDVDRRDGTTPVVGTEYSVKATYVESDNSEVEFTSTTGVITNSNGTGITHLDKTRDNTVVTYTVKEDKPATNYQSLGTDIKVIVTFDENGYVSNVAVENDSNLSKIETANKVDPVVNPEDNFIVNLELKNNPILKFNLTAMDGSDHSVKIKNLGFQIVSTMDDTVYSNSSATNRVNKTENPETSYTDVNGYTASYLDRTLDNKDMYYTIKEVQKSPGYEWADEDIIIKVSYDQDGKISSITPTQGAGLISITSYDAINFEINIEIYNEEIKEFGIHLTAADTYDINKKLNNMKVEAFLVEPGNSSYVSDGKYELVGENALLTGEDKDNDGKPDLSYGEDYKTIGAFKEITEGEVTRTLRLVIKNDSYHTAQSGYYLDSYDGTNNGKNVGYYKGTTYYSDAEYQAVKYEYLINVTFDSNGKIKAAKLQTGLNNYIGWLANEKYIEVDENGNLSHTDYRLNITMKFFPMLDLKLNAMDNYTYKDEVNSNGLPIALEGSKYTISTARHYAGTYTQKDEFVTAGYIGYGNTYGINSNIVYGDIYEDTNRLLAPIEKNNTRLYYVFEEIEPTNYQEYTNRYNTLYEEKLTAIISIAFNEYGEIDYDNSIVRKVDENIIQPYMAENGKTYLSSNNNILEYNYYYAHQSAKRDVDFYIGYALTTKINVTAIDDISGSPISNIRMYPFVNNTKIINGMCVTDTSYEYNVYGYRDTNSDGQFSIKYRGAAVQNDVNQYIIGSSRQGGNYNGYLFPSDIADASLGGSENEKDYYAKLDVTYDNNGKISKVTSVGSDLWGDDNVANITWDSATGNIYINMLYSRKFQMTLNKIDYYDSTIKDLIATFDVVSNRGLKTSISSKKMTPIGKVYKDTTIKYTLSETEVPNGYYPLTDTVDYYVTFDKDGNIGTNTVKSNSNYFEVVNTSNTTEKINKTSPDLTINIKDKPAFNLDLRVIDKFYKNDGIGDVYLKVTNSKGDTALGNPQTDINGYAKVVTGPVYPGKTVKYYISQTNTVAGYYKNSTTIELEVEFNDAGKVQNYKIISGNEVINNFNSTAYMNTREISMQIMNMPKDLKIGLYKYDKTTNLPMEAVPFTMTKEDLNSGATSSTTITTEANGAVIQTIDTFDTSISGKTIKYTLHEDETPASYRTMEDVVFIIRYNPDGSIASCNQVPNDNGVLNTKVVPQIAIGTINYLNDERVHFLVNVPNDNAFDIVIKNEDINYSGLGVEESQFDVSVNGVSYKPELTDVDGKTTIKDITESGDITIKIAQREVGEGYRFDVDNTVEINLVKGIDVYSLDLKSTTEGYVDDKNATTTKAIVVVDETYGTITVTFKNETKTEITVLKQDVNTKAALKDTEFEVIAQQIDSRGNNVGDAITLTTDNNKFTDINGQLYFDIGVAPQSQIWEYTFTEITPPAGYNPIVDLTMTVTYDQYGRILTQTSNKASRLCAIRKHTDNENCRNMYAIIYNGDVSPAYTVKVVTEDADTGKRINGSGIYLNITDENRDLIKVEPKTLASAQNGSTSSTGNLGLDGKKYSDEKLENKEDNAPTIIEKGLAYIDNVDYEGIINIEVSQTETANGYVFGNQNTDGNIQINAEYIPHLDGDPTVKFTVNENDGLEVRTDDVNRIITIVIKNESQVMFDITTKQYNTDSKVENVYIQGVNYDITAEIQTATDSIMTDINEKTPISDENGKTQGNVGHAYAGKTVLYTLHQNTPSGYKPIDDIQIEVQYDSKGYIKQYEQLSSEDNCNINKENTNGRNISVVVQNRKQLTSYKVYVEKHTMDTEEDTTAYSKLLSNAKYRITVEQQYNEPRYTTWTDVTDNDGLIKGLTFNGFGYITITLEELKAPEGYELDTLRYFKLYRDPNTGAITKVDGNVNIDDKETKLDEYGNTIIKLMPIDKQAKNKFTLVINKFSTATNKYITDNKAEFKAELIKEDIDGNIVYKDTINNIYTDENGKAIIDNQNMPGEEGEYKLVVTELKAPEGYVKLSNPIEIPVVFAKDSEGNITINNVITDGLQNVSTSKVNKQLLGINIGNDVDDVILNDEYSLDITKVDSETKTPIEDMAIFKVWLPDDKNTSVYTETKETLLGQGKLDYCYIEQDKDYQVRLTHMKLPKQDGVLKYTFKEVVAPNGYIIIPKNLELNVEFATDQSTGKMYIANVTSSDSNYLKINTVTPCTTDTRLEVQILNNKESEKQYTIHYNANDNGEGTQVPTDQIKQDGIDIILDTMIPIREGYVFKGWAITNTATTGYFNSGDTYSLNQDITLYAVWELENYTVHYDANDNGENTAVPANQIKTHGVNMTIDATIPVRQGYIFKGWATTDTAVVAEYQPGDTFSENKNTTLYAIWEIGKYTVHYDANDNGENTIVPGDQIKQEGIDIKIDEAKPTRNGYVFDGWATTPEATKGEYIPGDIYSENKDLTLYAVWIDELYITSVDYKITDASVQKKGIFYTINYDKNKEFEYNEGDKYIVGIIPRIYQFGTAANKDKQGGTSVTDFLANLNTNADTIRITKKKLSNDKMQVLDEEISGEDLIGTGMTVEFTKGNNQTVTLETVVIGDLTNGNALESGDGIWKSNDSSLIKTNTGASHQKMEEHGQAFVIALDVLMDGNIKPTDATFFINNFNKKSISELKSKIPWLNN